MTRQGSFIALFVAATFCGDVARAGFSVVRDGQPTAEIVADTRGSEGGGPEVLKDAAQWLADSLKQASGAEMVVVEWSEDVEQPGDAPAVVIARADAWPEVAATAGLKANSYDAYCIVTEPRRVLVLGNSEAAARHGVADLLRRIGFRWFAPSPRWHIVPKLKDIAIDVDTVDAPALVDRRIWYAYGMSGDDLKPLMQNYQRWAIANRLSIGSVIQTGHSYGNIISRNQETFDQHPEYYAMLPDGARDNQRAVNARKLCYTNPDLIALVVRDRMRLLEANRRINPAARMVSVDPSDGEGTCYCERCAKLATTADRVFYLANQTARGLREKFADAWVGLYAYSSHRLPPTIDVEPNVYVQVAMGFNRTKYSLPELVELWSRKVGAIGLREYYGVEAWDWGLPGRARGARVSYHQKWIPYYAARKLNAINAETNANWGAQTLGLYVAAQLMWEPQADVAKLVNEFFDYCYSEAEEPMRSLQAKFDCAPPLRAATLLPLFRDLQMAWQAARSTAVRQRLVDSMAYLVYVSRFRDFDLVRAKSSNRGGEYYNALLPLMNYAWRIRHRDTVHYYALARRLCNGLPLQDERLDFYMFNKQQPPVWMQGTSFSDDEIVALFTETIGRLEADGDPTVAYSRYLEPVRAPSDDAGASGILSDDRKAVARFRHGLRGYLVPAGPQTVRFGVAPTGRPVTFTVYLRGETILFQQEYHNVEAEPAAETGYHEVAVELPKANEYQVEITGDFVLRVPAEAPFVFEASVTHPAWIDYSGPHYFYVPQGTKELIVDANPRLSFFVPGQQQRVDIVPAGRKEGKQYAVIAVPASAAGRIWHTTNMTRGQVSLLNVPPLMSFHRDSLFTPREVAEADGLTTNGR